MRGHDFVWQAQSCIKSERPPGRAEPRSGDPETGLHDSDSQLRHAETRLRDPERRLRQAEINLQHPETRLRD